MSEQEEVKLEVGDLVECSFHQLRFEGVIQEISDGSERGFPGELMYLVVIEDQGRRWLYRYEILKKLDPDGSFKDAVRAYTRQQLEIRRRLINSMITKVVAKRVKEHPFKGAM